MNPRHRRAAVVFLAVLCLAWSTPVKAQVEESLSAFTEQNATGYLGPLKDALGSGLSDGLFTSAHIPQASPYVRLDFRAMIINYGDDDRTFQGQTEDYFPGDATAEVPTVVGDFGSVTVTDPGSGAEFTFPGGLNMDRMALAVPQLVVGGMKGTEGILRYIAVELGDDQLGDFSLFGIGARHSISQYFNEMPINLSGMLMYQSLSLGDDFLDASQISLGVQGSKSFPWIEPYAGLGLDFFKMDVSYEADQGGSTSMVDVDFDRDTNFHLTLGTALRFFLVHLNGEVNVSKQTSFALGLSIGN